MDAYRAQRKLACLQQGVTWQPQILLLGNDIFNVEQSLVLLTDTVFETESVLKAVYVCYKLFFAFNLKYPAQSADPWLFLQQGLYNMFTNSDKLSPRLHELISLIGSSELTLTLYFSSTWLDSRETVVCQILS